MHTRFNWSPDAAKLSTWETEQRRWVRDNRLEITEVINTPVILIPIKHSAYTWNLDWWALGIGYTDGDLAGLEIDITRKPTPGYQRVLVLI